MSGTRVAMRPIVLDASAVVPWFVTESVTPAAEQLLRSVRPLIAPRHLLSEVTNAVLVQQRRGRLEAGHAEAAWTLLGAMAAGGAMPPIKLFDERESLFFLRAISLSEALQHSLYDCFYLVLAQREAAALATFDQRLAALARRLSISLWAVEDAT